MTKNGVKFINFTGIDNLMFRPLDPIFVGFFLKNGLQICQKTVEKTDPKE